MRVILAFPLVAALVVSACSDAPAAPTMPPSIASTPTPPANPTPKDTVKKDSSAVPVPTPTPTSTSSMLAGATLWIDPNSLARTTADSWRATRPTDAAQLDKIASQPQAIWFGNWNTDITGDVRSAMNNIGAAGGLPVFVAYNIPQRDCGGLSGGNDVAPAQYKQWISNFAAGIGSSRAVVILEPDALAAMDCLSSTDQETRLSLLAYAVSTFRSLGSTAVYIDAGHADWQSAATMATRLDAAGVADAAGFSLNVSNFVSDADNIAYGRQVSALVGGKHYVIDSSRNGLGPTADAQWCNPTGRALGTRPTTHTGVGGLDAFLWIKHPGESDGACNGGPDAGVWWADYALGLARRAVY